MLIALALDRRRRWASRRSGRGLAWRWRGARQRVGGARRVSPPRSSWRAPSSPTSWDTVREPRQLVLRRLTSRRCAAFTSRCAIEAHLAPEDPRRFDLEHQRAVEAAAGPAAAAGPLRLGHVDRPVRADRAALRRDLLRPRRPARGEPHDDRRRRARDDLRLAGIAPPAEDGDARFFAGIRSRFRREGAAAVFYGIWPALVVAGGDHGQEEVVMNGCDIARADGRGAGRCVLAPLHAADTKVDLSKERSASRRSHSNRWSVRGSIAQDGAEKVVMVDGRPWVASKDNPDQAADRERAQAVRHLERGADGQREAVRLLPGGAAQGRAELHRTAPSR